MGLISNPVLRGFSPDPSMVRVGDDYYIATSTFQWFPGVYIHHSRNLIDWELITKPLNRLSLLDMSGIPNPGGVWAPCLSYDGGTFYLVYTNVKSSKTDWPFLQTPNYLVTAENIEGPWSEPVYLNSSGFDPSLFHDDDGRKYIVNMEMNYKRGEPHMSGILLQEYAEKEGKLIGRAHKIYRSADINAEGSHLYRANGYYYLVTAEGGTWENHCVCVSRSQTITGPYEPDPFNPVLTSKDSPDNPLQRAGHGSLVQTPDGDWYMAHLCGRPLPESRKHILGRETAIQKLVLNEEGWFRLEDGGRAPKLYVPTQYESQSSASLNSKKDHFDNKTLNCEYQTLRLPVQSDMSLAERPSHLRLYGGASLSSNYRQSLIARRQQAFVYTATTSVDFSPSHHKQMAGLVCIYDTQNYCYLYITSADDKRRKIGILTRNRGTYDQPDGHALIDSLGPVFLKASMDYEKLQFLYSVDQEEWIKLEDVLDANILTDENADGFSGAFVGICCQDLNGTRNHADFDWFEYIELEEKNIQWQLTTKQNGGTGNGKR